MRILCPWCHAWFSFDTPDGFFPHFIDAHPQSAQARAVVAAASQSRGTAAPQKPPRRFAAPQFAIPPTGL